MRCGLPIVEGAGPEQQPTRERNPLEFSGLGEASDEVEGENDEERDIPGMEPQEMKNEFWAQIKKIKKTDQGLLAKLQTQEHFYQR